MFYVDVSGDATTVNAAVNAMVSSAPGPVETPLLTAIQSLVTTAVTNSTGTPNYSGKFQVQIRGGFQNGTTQFSAKINSVELDAAGNVRMGSTATRASAFTP